MIKALTALCVLCVLGALVLGGWLAWFYVHSAVDGAALLQQAQSRIDAGVHPSKVARLRTVSCRPPSGAIGELVIPSIGLVAPVVQGVTDAQLSDAVGHVPTSVWPGGAGATVLDGHDVTWFHEIDKLRPGAEIEYLSGCMSFTYRVTGAGVVTKGSPVENRTGHLALVTCWPLDALWYTGQRFLVSASIVGGAKNVPAVTLPAAPQVPHLSVPPTLASVDTLAQNPTPLGALSETGNPSTTFVESPGPLDDASAAQNVFFAALRAAQAGNASQWAAMAPGVLLTAASVLSASKVVGFGNSLSTSLSVTGNRMTGASLSEEVVLSGPHAGEWTISATESVQGGTLWVTGWDVVPA